MTGIGLIIQKRKEQIENHNYTLDHDIQHHPDQAIVTAAMFATTLQSSYNQAGWERFENKIWNKPMVERYAIAAALLAAEIDRLQGE